MQSLLEHARLSFLVRAPLWLQSAIPPLLRERLPRMPSKSEAISGFRFLSQRFWVPSSPWTMVSNTTTLSTKSNVAFASTTRRVATNAVTSAVRARTQVRVQARLRARFACSGRTTVTSVRVSRPLSSAFFSPSTYI